jgi:hypothetical protein
VDSKRAFDPRLPEFARDAHVCIELDVGQPVVDDLELIRLDRDLHAPDLPLVNRELTRHAERVLVFVEEAERLDLNAIGCQRDPRVEPAVSALRQIGDREGPIAYVDRPAQVRVSGRAGHPHVCLECATHLGDLRHESRDQPEAEGAALHRDVQLLAGTCSQMLVSRVGGGVGRIGRFEERGRHEPLRGDPCLRRLGKLRVQTHPVDGVDERAIERLVLELAERAARNRERRIRARCLACARQRGGRAQRAANLLLAEHDRIHAGDVDGFRPYRQRVPGPAERAVNGEALCAADQSHALHHDPIAAVLNGCLSARLGAPFDSGGRHGQVPEVDLLVIGVHHQVAVGGQRPLLLEDPRLEPERLVLPRRTRGRFGDIAAGNLQQRGGRVGSDLGAGRLQVGHADVIGRLRRKHAGGAVSQVADRTRAFGLERALVAGKPSFGRQVPRHLGLEHPAHGL